MRKVGFLVMLSFCSSFLFAQLVDDFSDGDFNSNPVWSGEDTSFIINASNQLQSDGPSATTSIYLSTPNVQFQNTEWTFSSILNLNPSSSNNARVYLMSNNSILEDTVRGYYVQLGGESGSVDDIDLYRQDGSSTTKIIDGPDGTLGKDSNSVSIKVLRDSEGNWSLLADTSGGINYVLQGNSFDNSYEQTTHFGVLVNHTSTRSTMYYFDNFEIKDMPITVLGATPLNSGRIEVSFTENLNPLTAEVTTNYTINNGVGAPITAFLNSTDSSKVILELGSDLIDGTTYTITINNVSSLSGDVISTNSTTSFTYYKEKNFKDIIITEIFPDPEPTVGLPALEFVEFYNTTQDTINLTNFQFKDASTTVSTLGEYKLEGQSYVIICANGDTSSFKPYGNVLGISNFPSLNNSGDDLQVFDNTGKLIDRVTYSDSWYKDNDKKDGGWTLEIVDPKNPCGEEDNWRASVNASGGTPGKINSVNASNPDLTSPEVVRAIANDANSVIVYFNEKLDEGTIVSSNFSIDNSINILSVSLNSDGFSVNLFLGAELLPQTLYKVSVSNVSDCIGNILNSEFNTAEFALPEYPELGDIIINEILFNPQTGGVDFVEFYNNSNKYIDMTTIKLLEFDNDTIKNIKTIISESYVVSPKNYVWISEDENGVSSFYPKTVTTNFIETDLPTYSNDEGTVAIGFYDIDSLIVSDKFNYNSSFHYELLDDEDGVSLERVLFDGVTNNQDNWHSAASSDNYATPGYQNSQQLNVSGIESQITIFPQVFTPDNDGDRDLTTINYSFDDNGYTINITLFDSHGRLIKNLVQNDLVGREGFYQWDGIDNQNQKANVGYYIAYVEIFDLDGNTHRFKKKLVVGTKF